MKQEIHENDLIYTCLSGSIVHGTWTDTDNLIIKGVFIKTNNSTKNYISPKENIHYYQLKYFFTLLQKGDPKIFSLLFTQDHFVLKTSNYWNYIKNNFDYFLSKEFFIGFTTYSKKFTAEWNKISNDRNSITSYRKRMYKKYKNDYDVFKAYNGIKNLDLSLSLIKDNTVDLKNIDRDILLKIKKGEYTLEQSLKDIEEKSTELSILLKDSNLNKKPNKEDIDRLEKFILKKWKERSQINKEN